MTDPIPPSAYPTLQPAGDGPPSMPSSWSCVALLHPFSPPQSGDTQPANPFFQLCVANISFVEGSYFSAQIAGTSYGTWWYVTTPAGTEVSIDQGATWTSVDIGWTLPDLGWFGDPISNAACAGSSPLNWMDAQTVEWWKIPVPIPASGVSAATWLWFDATTKYPVRMMFGYGPPSPTMGDPSQLALFQMYSFTYIPMFERSASVVPPAWTDPTFQGFEIGNPNGYENFVWSSNFGMTVFMTPVNEAFNPLPTRVLYVWKPDPDYSVASDRAQNTLMLYEYNSGNMASQEALLMGPPPPNVPPPPNSETGFLINNYNDGTPQSCIQFPFPQEPPDWVSIPAVEATVQATIMNNPVLCPDTIVTIYSVLFPPAPPNYPDSTYLWTWYSPLTPDGTQSRPVTFMQSQSGVGVGTSLALADYFDYELFSEPIDPSNFAVPSACTGQQQSRPQQDREQPKRTLRFRLP
ncbi:MAG: hypothetical protein ACREXK_07785 [Gammaproteobacteria bacterium]